MLAVFKVKHAVVGLFATVAMLGFGGAAQAAGADPVLENPEAIEGIAGSYVRNSWVVPQGEIVSLTISGTMEGPEFKGTYTRKVKRTCWTYGCDIETGRFFAVGTNPANGWAFMHFFGEGDEIRDTYVINALNLYPFGKIRTMSIARWDGENASIGTYFTLSRLGL